MYNNLRVTRQVLNRFRVKQTLQIYCYCFALKENRLKYSSFYYVVRHSLIFATLNISDDKSTVSENMIRGTIPHTPK